MRSHERSGGRRETGQGGPGCAGINSPSTSRERSLFRFEQPLVYPPKGWCHGVRRECCGYVVGQHSVACAHRSSRRRILECADLARLFICVTFIVAALKSLHDRERQLSRVDSLTGIGNRLAFYEFATAERNRAGRSNQPITLAYLDLDGFKGINDTLGHQTGDKVLVSWRERCR